VTAAVIFLAVITWLVWYLRRQYPYLLVGWLWFLGTLVPVIGLVQVGQQAMADRYTYVPLIGVFIAISFGIRDLIARFQIGIVLPAAAASLILGSFLALTEHQLSYWKDDEILFSHALAVTKNNDTACINLGVVLEKQGFQAKALAQYQEALRINSRSVQAHNNLGNLLSEMGKTNEALVQYQEALKLNPRAPLAHDNLGMLLVKLSRFDEAMSQYEQAAQLDPGDFRPYYLMGKALLKQGRDAEAVDKFREALQLDPHDFQTLAFLARVLASDENPQIRNGAEAVALAEKANDLTGGEHPFVLDTLAISYAEVSRFQDAQQIEQRAIQLARTAALEETNAMFQRLELYKSGQPYRETSKN
jgi:tetratricopeptide (TPR) repeat protein